MFLSFPTRAADPRRFPRTDRGCSNTFRRRRLSVETLEERSLLSVAAPAPTVEMLKDLNSASAGSYPADFVGLGGSTYFVATNETGSFSQFQLWKTDGTGGGTTQVSELGPNVGDFQTEIKQVIQVGGVLYFSAWYWSEAADENFYGLFRSNGTPSGTSLVRQFAGEVGTLVDVNGTLYFDGQDAAQGYGLWKSNGTAGGTVLVLAFENWIGEVTNVGGQVYFAENDGVNGDALWKSNGTAGGTVLLERFAVDPEAATIRDLTVFSNKLYFAADDGTSGDELWTTDGTASGTVVVKDLFPGMDGGFPWNLAAVNGALYFRATDGTSSLDSIWKTDGSALGTVLIKDLSAETGHEYYDEWDMTEVGGAVYFLADDGALGLELWKTDGSAPGTSLVTTITPGASGGYGYSRDFSLETIGPTLYFRAEDEASGAELWKSDGTALGTVRVSDIYPGSIGSFPGDLTNVGDTLYFSARGTFGGVELWKSNGTSAGTARVKDINTAMEGSGGREFTTVGSTTFFFAMNGHDGRLWKTDGTRAGTVLVKDIDPTREDDILLGLTRLGSRVIFNTTDPNWSDVNQVWVSDGTGAGTRSLTGTAGEFSFVVPGLTASGNWIYFVADDAISGREVWKTDGTEAGTTILKDLAAGSESTNPQSLVDVGGTLYFTGDLKVGDITVTALWKSNGTEAGTTLVKALPFSTQLQSLTNVGGKLYFTVEDPVYSNWALWTSDGSEAGTVEVSDIAATGPNGGQWQMAGLNGLVYILIADSGYGLELWKSDGTDPGTELIRSFAVADASESYLVEIGGALYFAADDGVSGQELWKSDGTAPGTVLVKDLDPGPAYSEPRELTPVGSVFYFRADSDLHEDDLWRSDGTDAGTVLVRTLLGADFYRASDLANANGQLLFAADDNVHGEEPWAITPPDIRLVSVTASGGTELTVRYNIQALVVPFEIGFYRSTDTALGAGDLLLDSVMISSAEDLTVGVHTKTFTIGGAADQVALPGAGAGEVDTDYFLLGVSDPENLVDETGWTNGETNNTAIMTGVYHVAGGPIMVHGTAAADVIKVLPQTASQQVEIDFKGTVYQYASSGVTGARIRGHAGNDELQFTVGAGFGSPGTLGFLFDGGSGINPVTLRGSTSTTAKDVAQVYPLQASMTGPKYSVTTQSVRGITVFGNGGPDEAYIYDSSLNDTFTAYPTYVTLSNSLYTNRAEGFRNVFAYAQVGGAYKPAGGNDVAYFHGIDGTRDYLRASAMYAIMADGETGRGTSYFVRGNWFEEVHAYGRTASGRPSSVDRDQANLFDAATSDLFEAATTTALATYAYSGASTINAHIFRVVKAYGSAGDTANLYGPGTYTPAPNPVMFTGDFTVWANGFGLNWYPDGPPAASSARIAAVDAALPLLFDDPSTPTVRKKSDPSAIDWSLAEV